MSLSPAHFSARRRRQDSAPLTESETGTHDDVFDLLQPEPSDRAEPDNSAGISEPPEVTTSGRNVHPIAMADLSRLSIDNDGRLYWDGKPVEVRRTILMSRAQVVGACIIGAFVAVGAIGAAIQGAAALRDWACRLGWSQSYCTVPGASSPRPPTDIPV